MTNRAGRTTASGSGMRRTLRLMVSMGVAATLMFGSLAFAKERGWVGPPPSGGGGDSVTDGSDPMATSLSLGAQWWVWSAAPGELGAVPQVMYADHLVDGRRTKKIIVDVARNADTSTAVQKSSQFVSRDNGKVWIPYRALGNKADSEYDAQTDNNIQAAGRLHDGTLMAVMFKPIGGNQALRVASSADLGKSWKKWDAPIRQNKWQLKWYRTTGRQIIELNDGTLLLGVYGAGTIDGVAGQFTVILQSTDEGKTWTQRSLVNTDGDSNELALARTSDGRLLAITRPTGGALTKPMKQTYSTDDGRTWQPQHTFVPPQGLPADGIMPYLVLQANGAMVLSYGRPDNYVAVSWDGTGDTWNTGKLVFSNYIRKGFRGRWMGSSGNTALAPGEANYSLEFGDICHNIWSCQEYGQQTGVWVRRVDAVTPGKGKIDLATGVRDGVITLSGDVVAPDPRFAEQRLQGAVDGSSAFRAAARFVEGKPARLTIDLGKEYTLDRIGLMLDRGVLNSAKVEVSTDGRHWSNPVVRQVRSTDYAVRYHDLDKPVQARYVRVLPDAGAPLTAVNEIELYAANMWTFENDAVNVTPRGLKDTLHTFTADTIMPGQNSERRAILVDTDPGTMAHATFPVAPMKRMHLAFGYAGEGYGTGANWEILGVDASGVRVAAWKFHFRPSGKSGFALTAWDGSTWQDVGTFPTFTPNYQWIPVVINASTAQASVTVHGKTLTTNVRNAAATQLDGFRPSTGLEASDINMEHSYDNVLISALPDYTVNPAEPAQTLIYPDRPVTVTTTVHNFTDAEVTLPVQAKAPDGYTVEGPHVIRVPANGSTDVRLKVTAKTAAKTAKLTIRIGDESTTVQLEPTADWVRSATMAASSTSSRSSVDNLNDGNTDTTTWGPGGAGAWNDNTPGEWPDRVTASWTHPVTLSKVVVYTRDAPPNAPASLKGVKDYDVQVSGANGNWRTVAQVRDNTEGVVTSTFDAVATSSLRILITDSNDHQYSRLVSIQAFS